MSGGPFKIAPPGWQPEHGGRGRTELVLVAALVIGLSAAALFTALMSLEVGPIVVAAARLVAFVALTRWLFRGAEPGYWLYVVTLSGAMALLFALEPGPGGAAVRWILVAVYGGALAVLLGSPAVRRFRRTQREAIASNKG